LFGTAWGIPSFGDSVQPWMSAVVVGIIVYIPGILFGEQQED